MPGQRQQLNKVWVAACLIIATVSYLSFMQRIPPASRGAVAADALAGEASGPLLSSATMVTVSHFFSSLQVHAVDTTATMVTDIKAAVAALNAKAWLRGEIATPYFLSNRIRRTKGGPPPDEYVFPSLATVRSVVGEAGAVSKTTVRKFLHRNHIPLPCQRPVVIPPPNVHDVVARAAAATDLGLPVNGHSNALATMILFEPFSLCESTSRTGNGGLSTIRRAREWLTRASLLSSAMVAPKQQHHEACATASDANVSPAVFVAALLGRVQRDPISAAQLIDLVKASRILPRSVTFVAGGDGTAAAVIAAVAALQNANAVEQGVAVVRPDLHDTTPGAGIPQGGKPQPPMDNGDDDGVHAADAPETTGLHSVTVTQPDLQHDVVTAFKTTTEIFGARVPMQLKLSQTLVAGAARPASGTTVCAETAVRKADLSGAKSELRRKYGAADVVDIQHEASPAGSRRGALVAVDVASGRDTRFGLPSPLFRAQTVAVQEALDYGTRWWGSAAVVSSYHLGLEPTAEPKERCDEDLSPLYPKDVLSTPAVFDIRRREFQRHPWDAVVILAAPARPETALCGARPDPDASKDLVAALQAWLGSSGTAHNDEDAPVLPRRATRVTRAGHVTARRFIRRFDGTCFGIPAWTSTNTDADKVMRGVARWLERAAGTDDRCALHVGYEEVIPPRSIIAARMGRTSGFGRGRVAQAHDLVGAFRQMPTLRGGSWLPSIPMTFGYGTTPAPGPASQGQQGPGVYSFTLQNVALFIVAVAVSAALLRGLCKNWCRCPTFKKK